MHAGGGGGGRKSARIEIIPLIDIIFFLLATFVMVSMSMTKNQGVQVALPSASSAASLGDSSEMDKTVTLTVNEKGELFFNKEQVTRPQLTYKLQNYKNATKDPRVIVTGDAHANFEGIVQVLDEARRIGISKVGISTDKK